MNSRRKHVTQGLREEVEALLEGQEVARVVCARGGNIMEVELANGRRTLCMMPARFHKKLWVRKGGFVVMEESESAAARDDKVTGTILQVLYEDHIRQLRKVPGAWPPEFDALPSTKAEDACALHDAVLPSLESDQVDRDQRKDCEGVAGCGPDGPASTLTGDRIDGLEGRLGALCLGIPPAGAKSTHEVEEGGAGVGVGAADARQQELEEEEEEEEEEDDLPPLFQNNNRRVIYHEVSDSDEEPQA